MKLKYKNIKNTSGEMELSSLTFVCGGNGSGKSAILDAMRLALTGRAEVGATNFGRIASENSYSLFSCEHGVRKWAYKGKPEGEDMQGGMPASVEEFWGLTNEQRLSLIGGREQLIENESEAAAATAALKKEQETLKATPPVQPERYDGPPASELQAKLSTVISKLKAHDDALAAQATAKRDALNLQATKDSLEELRTKEKSLLRDQLATSIELDEWRAKRCPPILLGNATVKEFLTVVADALLWVAPDKYEELAKMMVSAEDTPIRQVSEEDSPVGKLHGIEVALESTQKNIKRAEEALQKAQEACDKHGIGDTDLLSDDEFEALVERQEALQKYQKQAAAWHAFESILERHAVTVAEANSKAEELKQQLQQLRLERQTLLQQLKTNVEDKANEMLQRCGQKPLSLEVAGSSKRIGLEVSVGGVCIEALAASERLLYGVCLLAAIHQASSASCPCLLVQAAEMDLEMLDLAAQALGSPERGVVLIEHWAAPEDGHIIRTPTALVSAT